MMSNAVGFRKIQSVVQGEKSVFAPASVSTLPGTGGGLAHHQTGITDDTSRPILQRLLSTQNGFTKRVDLGSLSFGNSQTLPSVTSPNAIPVPSNTSTSPRTILITTMNGGNQPYLIPPSAANSSTQNMSNTQIRMIAQNLMPQTLPVIIRCAQSPADQAGTVSSSQSTQNPIILTLKNPAAGPPHSPFSTTQLNYSPLQVVPQRPVILTVNNQSVLTSVPKSQAASTEKGLTQPIIISMKRQEPSAPVVSGQATAAGSAPFTSRLQEIANASSPNVKKSDSLLYFKGTEFQNIQAEPEPIVIQPVTSTDEGENAPTYQDEMPEDYLLGIKPLIIQPEETSGGNSHSTLDQTVDQNVNDIPGHGSQEDGTLSILSVSSVTDDFHDSLKPDIVSSASDMLNEPSGFEYSSDASHAFEAEGNFAEDSNEYSSQDFHNDCHEDEGDCELGIKIDRVFSLVDEGESGINDSATSELDSSQQNKDNSFSSVSDTVSYTRETDADSSREGGSLDSSVETYNASGVGSKIAHDAQEMARILRIDEEIRHLLTKDTAQCQSDADNVHLGTQGDATEVGDSSLEETNTNNCLVDSVMSTDRLDENNTKPAHDITEGKIQKEPNIDEALNSEIEKLIPQLTIPDAVTSFYNEKKARMLSLLKHDHTYAGAYRADPEELDYSTDSVSSLNYYSSDEDEGIHISGTTILEVETVTPETILADPALKNILWRRIGRGRKAQEGNLSQLKTDFCDGDQTEVSPQSNRLTKLADVSSKESSAQKEYFFAEQDTREKDTPPYCDQSKITHQSKSRIKHSAKFPGKSKVITRDQIYGWSFSNEEKKFSEDTSSTDKNKLTEHQTQKNSRESNSISKELGQSNRIPELGPPPITGYREQLQNSLGEGLLIPGYTKKACEVKSKLEYAEADATKASSKLVTISLEKPSEGFSVSATNMKEEDNRHIEVDNCRWVLINVEKSEHGTEKNTGGSKDPNMHHKSGSPEPDEKKPGKIILSLKRCPNPVKATGKIVSDSNAHYDISLKEGNCSSQELEKSEYKKSEDVIPVENQPKKTGRSIIIPKRHAGRPFGSINKRKLQMKNLNRRKAQYFGWKRYKETKNISVWNESRASPSHVTTVRHENTNSYPVSLPQKRCRGRPKGSTNKPKLQLKNVIDYDEPVSRIDSASKMKPLDTSACHNDNFPDICNVQTPGQETQEKQNSFYVKEVSHVLSKGDSGHCLNSHQPNPLRDSVDKTLDITHSEEEPNPPIPCPAAKLIGEMHSESVNVSSYKEGNDVIQNIETPNKSNGPQIQDSNTGDNHMNGIQRKLLPLKRRPGRPLGSTKKRKMMQRSIIRPRPSVEGLSNDDQKESQGTDNKSQPVESIKLACYSTEVNLDNSSSEQMKAPEKRRPGRPRGNNRNLGLEKDNILSVKCSDRFISQNDCTSLTRSVDKSCIDACVLESGLSDAKSDKISWSEEKHFSSLGAKISNDPILPSAKSPTTPQPPIKRPRGRPKSLRKVLETQRLMKENLTCEKKEGETHKGGIFEYDMNNGTVQELLNLDEQHDSPLISANISETRDSVLTLKSFKEKCVHTDLNASGSTSDESFQIPAKRKPGRPRKNKEGESSGDSNTKNDSGIILPHSKPRLRHRGRFIKLKRKKELESIGIDSKLNCVDNESSVHILPVHSETKFDSSGEVQVIRIPLDIIDHPEMCTGSGSDHIPLAENLPEILPLVNIEAEGVASKTSTIVKTHTSELKEKLGLVAGDHAFQEITPSCPDKISSVGIDITEQDVSSSKNSFDDVEKNGTDKKHKTSYSEGKGQSKIERLKAMLKKQEEALMVVRQRREESKKVLESIDMV